ncbi:protein of unknown function [Moritella yayanosii]|uniref:Uncharacterized protein n=1 Tax=Moritella yayanosii TaxID=69539 RepID=A0A330LU02_9GAMM|nr:protein of unknown function [Moritella yayanosii]
MATFSLKLKRTLTFLVFLFDYFVTKLTFVIIKGSFSFDFMKKSNYK